MATPAHEEVQKLLRFLTQDAKIPLAVALPKIGALRKENLNTPESIAKASQSELQSIFEDERASKQVSNAAKRVTSSRKRTASPTPSSPGKKIKTEQKEDVSDPEASLELPTTEADTEELKKIEIETNRAPFFLAFTVVLLEFTMPEQPLSSRLSLAQAVVSANSQSKAKTIGLAGSTAEDEGWAHGQPKVKIMNRQIAVMRRDYRVPTTSVKLKSAPTEDGKATIKSEEQETTPASVPSYHQAFWGLNLDALRKSNGRLAAGKMAGSTGPPIYSAESARSYLLKSLSVIFPPSAQQSSNNNKKAIVKQLTDDRSKAVAVTMKAIRLLCESWADTLNQEQLDARAWAWYAQLRPEVAQGQAGWGQRGKVKLSNVLALRRQQ